MFSPHLCQPRWLYSALSAEYINGRMPSLYRLSGFVRLMIENLRERKYINRFKINRLIFRPNNREHDAPLSPILMVQKGIMIYDHQLVNYRKNFQLLRGRKPLSASAYKYHFRGCHQLQIFFPLQTFQLSAVAINYQT